MGQIEVFQVGSERSGTVNENAKNKKPITEPVSLKYLCVEIENEWEKRWVGLNGVSGG